MSDGLIRLTYRLETSGDIPALAAKIASDQPTGTFTELSGETEEMRARCAARGSEIKKPGHGGGLMSPLIFPWSLSVRTSPR